MYQLFQWGRCLLKTLSILLLCYMGFTPALMAMQDASIWQSEQQQSALQLLDTEQPTRLSSHFKVFFETEGPEDIADIIASREQFQWPEGKNPNYGFDSQGIWFHTSLSNVSDTKNWIIDIAFAQNDLVDFYLVKGQEILAESHQGKQQKDLQYRFPTFKFQLPFAERVDLFIRVESDEISRVVPIDIMSEKTHLQQSTFDSILWGIFYGGLLVLAIYNLTLYINLRESSLLAYVFYIGTVIIWQFVWGGHIQVFTSSFLTSWLNQHTDLLFILVGISAGIFTLLFLNAKTTAPKVSRFIYMALICLLLMVPLSLFDVLIPKLQSGLVYGINILGIISYLYAGYESYGNNFHPARYFIFAWSILLTGALIGMFGLIGVLPSNFFTTYCFQFGVFIEAGLFSLALMEKSRAHLEAEIEDVTAELRNNLEKIEEQSARLDIARKEAIKASQVKSQFLANMSHEFRTPLNAILGFGRELTKLPLPTDKREHLKIVNDSASHLLHIVNDVLDFSKIESGKLQINNEPFNPSEMLEQLASSMATGAHLKKLEFVFELPPLPGRLIGDAARIRQVLTSLLNNAIKFTSSGYVRLAVDGEDVDEHYYRLRLQVQDTGIGISQQDQSKLFNAFSQLDNAMTRSYQGTGLGLVICRELVKLMRGQIQLNSQVSQGSFVEVTIKLHKLDNRPQYGLHPHWQEKNVLIIDPCPQSRRAAVRLMQSLGAKTTSGESQTFLDSVSQHYDYLFVSLPSGKELSSLPELPASLHQSNKVFIGDNQQQHVSSVFSQSLLKPLSYERLQTLLYPQTSTELNISEVALYQLPKARVLAVDDMEINLRLLKTWLKRSPVELHSCYNGQDAVDLCIKQEFDLILMDVQMPNMDGLQATRLIRQTQNNIGTPIIAVTAHAFKEEEERLLASGMDGYLPKPVSLEGLADLINRWCSVEHIDNTELKSVDWSVALKQANNNPALAMQMLDSFLQQLPILAEQVKQGAQDNDFDALQKAVHGLHGVSCYSGVPKLQSICDAMETELKQGRNKEALEMMANFEEEVEMVLQSGENVLAEQQKVKP